METNEKQILNQLKELYQTIKHNGYDPESQIIGYLSTGDLGYISNKSNCRNLIQNYDREDYLEALLHLAKGVDLEQ